MADEEQTKKKQSFAHLDARNQVIAELSEEQLASVAGGRQAHTHQGSGTPTLINPVQNTNQILDVVKSNSQSIGVVVGDSTVNL